MKKFQGQGERRSGYRVYLGGWRLQRTQGAPPADDTGTGTAASDSGSAE